MSKDSRTIHPLTSSKGFVECNCGRDKSLTHRAIMFSSLAVGRSKVYSPLLGADCLSTMNCFRKLGVSFDVQEGLLIVDSDGPAHFIQPQENLDCGNSGTTARLLTGLLAGIPGLKCRLTGDQSLSSRPMGRVVEPLRQMGAKISGPSQGEKLPIDIVGTSLKGCKIQVDKASAQVKSAIIFAALSCHGDTEVRLPKGSREHTERMLRAMDSRCQTHLEGGEERISIEGPFMVPTGQYRIPVDPSSAAFFCVYGLLRPTGRTVTGQVLDNPTRTGFLRVLKAMSQKIVSRKGDGEQSFVEPTLDIEVKGGFPLAGVTIEADLVPTLVDEIPILAVAAAFASSPSHFKGLEELRVKESNRLDKTLELLQVSGCQATIEGDDLVIQGGLQKAHAFSYDSLEDHRLAMAASIMAKFADGPCTIENTSCVAVSFPNFYEELEKFES